MNKTIKVIDLLNKIAKGEEVPKKIKIRDKIYEYKYTTNGTGYVTEDWDWFNDMMFDEQLTLNMDVEIIEEQEEIDIQEIKEITSFGIKQNQDGINLLIRAVKQLDNKLKGE